MEYQVQLTGPALQDLRDIYQYIRVEDSSAAEDWYIGLRATIFSLAQLPLRGSLLEEEDDTLRRILYGNKPHVYRILYKIDLKHRLVTVLHIRHGARAAIMPTL